MNNCPKCGSEYVTLVDPVEDEEYELDPDDFDEGAEVWFCHDCEWHEEADPEEALDYHTANIEWALARIASNQDTRPT